MTILLAGFWRKKGFGFMEIYIATKNSKKRWLYKKIDDNNFPCKCKFIYIKLPDLIEFKKMFNFTKYLIKFKAIAGNVKY